MSTSAPIDPKPTGAADPTQPPAAHDFELMLHRFWARNSKFVYLAIVTVILVIVARGGFEYFQSQREKSIAADYAAATTNEKLKSFIAAQPEHLLSGVAHLRLADEAYGSARYAEADSAYQKAAAILKDSPFSGRAQLGSAVSKVYASQVTEGAAKLRQLADDPAQLKSIRAEAAYHLGTLAAEAGRNEEAIKYFDQVSTLDMAGQWTQRAMIQRASLDASPVPTPSIQLPANP